MLIVINENEFIPVSRLISARFSPRLGEPARIIYDSGEGSLGADSDLDLGDLERMLYPVVAAQPGYYALEIYGNPPVNGGFHRYPVVAWRIDGACAHPVTLEWELPGSLPILTPDGTVIVAGDRIFGSAQEWFLAVTGPPAVGGA